MKKYYEVSSAYGIAYRYVEDNELFKYVTANGMETYYKNRIYHREDGPAVITADGKTKLYYLNNKILDKEVWEKLIKMKAFW